MLNEKKIAILGAGNMGDALVSGLIGSESSAPKNIICKKYNVMIDKVDDYEVNDDVIEKVKDYMKGSISEMKELLYDKENNTAREEDFELTEDEMQCRMCNFKKICPKWS